MEKFYTEILVPAIGSVIAIILNVIASYLKNIRKDIDDSMDKVAQLEASNIIIKEKLDDMKKDIKDIEKEMMSLVISLNKR